MPMHPSIAHLNTKPPETQRYSLLKEAGIEMAMATVKTAESCQAKWTNLERNWRRVASTHTLQELMDEEMSVADDSFSMKTLLVGCFLIVLGAGSLCWCCFAIVTAPFLPALTYGCFKAIQADKYYQLLIPLTIPVMIITVFLNWFCMKLYKHNS